MLIFRNIIIIIGVFMFQGVFEEIGMPSDVFKYVAEVMFIVLLFPFINRIRLNRAKNMLIFIMFLYVMIILFSTLYNDNTISLVYNYSRYTLFGVIVYLLSSEITYASHRTKKMFSLLVLVNVIQVGMSLINSSFLTNPLERKVGTISSSGGSLATIYSIFMAPFFLSFYLYTNEKKYLWYYLSTLIVGIASGKRAVIFFFIVVSILTIIKTSTKKINIFKISFMAIVLLLVVNFSVINVSSGAQGGNPLDFLSNLSNAIDYGLEYNTSTSVDGASMGRTSTSKNVLSYFYNSNIYEFFYGFGPKALMGETKFDKINILYGIAGWSKEFISLGFIGFSLYLTFVLKLKNRVKKINFSKFDHTFNGLLIGVKVGYISWLIAFFLYSSSFQDQAIPLFIIMFIHGYLEGSKKSIRT